jgi:hypothetical protein
MSQGALAGAFAVWRTNADRSVRLSSVCQRIMTRSCTCAKALSFGRWVALCKEARKLLRQTRRGVQRHVCKLMVAVFGVWADRRAMLRGSYALVEAGCAHGPKHKAEVQRRALLAWKHARKRARVCANSRLKSLSRSQRSTLNAWRRAAAWRTTTRRRIRALASRVALTRVLYMWGSFAERQRKRRRVMMGMVGAHGMVCVRAATDAWMRYRHVQKRKRHVMCTARARLRRARLLTHLHAWVAFSAHYTCLNARGHAGRRQHALRLALALWRTRVKVCFAPCAPRQVLIHMHARLPHVTSSFNSEHTHGYSIMPACCTPSSCCAPLAIHPRLFLKKAAFSFMKPRGTHSPRHIPTSTTLYTSHTCIFLVVPCMCSIRFRPMYIFKYIHLYTYAPRFATDIFDEVLSH